MKKFFLTTLLLLSSRLLHALPIGNPSEASLFTQGVFFGGTNCNTCDPCFCWFDAWSLRVGYYGDFVFNRNLKVDAELSPGQVIETTEMFTNAGYLALNICNKLDVFGTLGTTRIGITTSNISWAPGENVQGHLDWETYFSWSVGARATLFQWRCFSVGVEGQYFQTDPKFTTFVSYDTGEYMYFNEDNKMRYREWQVGTGLSYTISTFCPNLSVVPYAGVKWAWSRFRTGEFEFPRGSTDIFTIANLKANKLWGYAVGLTTTFCGKIGVTVEGRWADEKAVYVNGQVRF